jgi:hypothetical protein
MSRLYKVQGRVFRLDPELYKLAKQVGVTRKDIEKDYNFMMKVTPGFKVVTHNHALYSAYVRKSKGKNLWEL